MEIVSSVDWHVLSQMDADYDPTQQRVKTKKKKKKGKMEKSVVQEELTSKKRRRSKFAEALEKPKPQFDASVYTLLPLIHASSLELRSFFSFINSLFYGYHALPGTFCHFLCII